METMTPVRVRRVGDSAYSAVFVAARLIGQLDGTRHVEVDAVDENLILLRVGPRIGQPALDGWAVQLLGEVHRMLREQMFAGWEPESST
jgi:hypothetical protein